MPVAQPAQLTAGLVTKGHAPRPPEPRMSAPPVAPAPEPETPAAIEVPAPPNEPMNFKMPPEFRYRFKRAALDERMQMNELLIKCFEAWEQRKAAGEGG